MKIRNVNPNFHTSFWRTFKARNPDTGWITTPLVNPGRFSIKSSKYRVLSYIETLFFKKRAQRGDDGVEGRKRYEEERKRCHKVDSMEEWFQYNLEGGYAVS
jgi:hypothetical protein